MKSRFIFWLLALIVFGSLGFFGFRFVETDSTMFLIVEGIALLGIILFIILYRRLIRPYRIIADGMDLLKEQDFSTRLRPISDSEANKLITVFNRMMDSLKEERLQVREKNHFLDLLIKASPQGVLILDFDENITDINPAGMKLLNIKDKSLVINRKIKETGINIANSLASLKPGDNIIVRDSGISAFRCTRSSFIDKGFNHPFILIEELTDELLRIEKKSYEGIIRMMAHEVNNSIGAISSTLNVVSDILKEDKPKDFSDVLPAVDASFDRCLHLGRFISNFADVVKLPEPQKKETDLNALARSVEALTNVECKIRNINFGLYLSDEEYIANIDPIQIEQVLVNIIKNAYEAIGHNGEIRIATNTNPASLTISNNGPEMSDEVIKNLFVPFFSTKPSGQGIGLMIVREILRNHNAAFRFYSKDGWTRFEMEF